MTGTDIANAATKQKTEEDSMENENEEHYDLCLSFVQVSDSGICFIIERKGTGIGRLYSFICCPEYQQN
jgi:hypothetical protein